MAPESQDRRDARPASPGRRRWRYLLVVGLIWAAVVVAAATGWRYARTSGPAYGPVILVSIDSLRAELQVTR